MYFFIFKLSCHDITSQSAARSFTSIDGWQSRTDALWRVMWMWRLSAEQSRAVWMVNFYMGLTQLNFYMSLTQLNLLLCITWDTIVHNYCTVFCWGQHQILRTWPNVFPEAAGWGEYQVRKTYCWPRHHDLLTWRRPIRMLVIFETWNKGK